MPATFRPSTLSFALKTLGSVVASAALLSSSVHAVELGKLTVLSALGQPLQAEVELQGVTPNDASSMVARLASAESFRLAHIALTPTLSSLRFQIEESNGRRVLRISTTQPVNEAFIDILLELNSNRGAQVREYTVLLDPIELKQVQSPQVAAPQWKRLDAPTPMAPVVTMQQAAPAPAPAAPAPVAATPPAAPALKPVAPKPAAPKPVAAKPAAPKPVAPAAKTESAYRVKKGDTLGRIAAQLKPADVSLDMMLLALYRANPDAFIGKNMNNLLSGKILALPDAALVRATDPDDAKSMVVAQAADFTAYRNKLAAQVAVSTATKQAQASQSATGKISAKVEERATEANAASDKLKLSKANSAKTAGKTAVAVVEDTIATAEQNAQAVARVKELEKNVSDIEKLMVLKNKALTTDSPAAASPPAAPSANWIDWVMQHLRTLGLVLAAILALALLVVRRLKKAEPESDLPTLTEPSITDFPSPPPATALDDRAKLAALLHPSHELDSEPAAPIAATAGREGAVAAEPAAPLAAAEVSLVKASETVVVAPVPVAALAKTLGQAAAVATERYLKTTGEPLPLKPDAPELQAEPGVAQQVETMVKPVVVLPPPSIVLDASDPAAQFDLSSINLDLKMVPAKAIPAVLDATPEMNTKLDLATAYQEIGDKEGARELLDEVIKGGNPSQAAKASVMRALLT